MNNVDLQKDDVMTVSVIMCKFVNILVNRFKIKKIYELKKMILLVLFVENIRTDVIFIKYSLNVCKRPLFLGQAF